VDIRQGGRENFCDRPQFYIDALLKAILEIDKAPTGKDYKNNSKDSAVPQRKSDLYRYIKLLHSLPLKYSLLP